MCCVITGKNEKERERKRGRERVMYLLATDSVIPVQTCVRPVRRLAVKVEGAHAMVRLNVRL